MHSDIHFVIKSSDKITNGIFACAPEFWGQENTLLGVGPWSHSKAPTESHVFNVPYFNTAVGTF